MMTDALDLSFFGVAGIWNNDLGKLSRTHLSYTSSKVVQIPSELQTR